MSLKNTAFRAPFIRLDIAVAVSCFAVLYTSITAFDRPTPWYHAQVSYQLIFASSVLFLPFMFLPGWKFESLITNVKPWLAVCLSLGVATIFSDDYVVSVPRLRLIYSVLLIGFLFRAWFSKAQADVIPSVLMAITLLHATVLPLVLVAYEHAAGDLGDFTTWLPYHSHIRHLGYHGMVAACSGLAFTLLVPRLAFVGYFLSLVALFGLIFFGSRGGLLSYFLFVGIILLFCAHKRRVILATSLIFLLAWGGAIGMSHMKSEHIGTVADRSTSTASVDSRLHLWSDALRAIKLRPFFGYGPEGYQTSHCCSPGHIQAHNSLLQILIEYGVFGFLAFAWLFKVTLVEAMIRLYRQKKAGVQIDMGPALVVSMIVSLLAYSMIDGVFYHVIPLLVFVILCGLLYSDTGDKVKATNSKS